MQNKENIWELADVTKTGFRQVRLDKLSITFSSGITAIIGESGAGKTSILNLLSKMELPDKGSVEFLGELGPCPYYIVPQDFGLWSHMTTEKHISEVIPDHSALTTGDFLEAFDLTPRAHEYPEFLSQGECSRLSIARALATHSPILVMDEPLANVDQSRKEKYWDFILDHLKKINGSLIFSTHLPSEVLAYADQVVCLKDGEVLAHDKVDEVYKKPSSKEIANLLGPGNWFEESNPFTQKTGFFRPEDVSLQADESAEFTIEKTTFFGIHYRSTLSNSKESRTIYHRASDNISKGMKVSLLFIFLLILSSCNKTQDSITFSELTSWNIPASGQRLPGPRAITCGNNEEVIVLDDAGRVLVYNQDGKLKRQWNMPETHLGHPEGVTVFPDGKIAVADTHFARVVVFNEDGTEAYRFGSRGDKPGQFYSPVGITLDDQQNIYVCEYGFNDRVQKFTKDGKFLVSFGKSGVKPGDMQRASDMVWTDGKLYVADAVNNRIQIFDDNGKFLSILKNGDQKIPFYLPYDIDLAPDGKLWIIEYANCKLTRTTLDGTILGTFGRPGTELNCFNNPWGLGIDDKGTIYVADTANRRVVVLRNPQ
ncbi:MAG: ATP-binding cassette domain-containing protein [Lentisphaeraceae bacterium]|nr:ATP-binding cassette domain-containing protein [Lentisphaeraceae bacterium]